MWMVGRRVLQDSRLLPPGRVWLQAIQGCALLSSTPVLQVDRVGSLLPKNDTCTLWAFVQSEGPFFFTRGRVLISQRSE